MSNALWNRWKKARTKFRKSHAIYIVIGDADLTKFCNQMHQKANFDSSRGLTWFTLSGGVGYWDVMADNDLSKTIVKYAPDGVSVEVIDGKVVLKSGGFLI